MSYDVQQSIIDRVSGKDIPPDFYLLYGAGRAACLARIAADYVESYNDTVILDRDPKMAFYHAYAGVSAVRTGLDALANWLRIVLVPNAPLQLHRVDFAEREFRKHVRQGKPALDPAVDQLRQLAAEIDGARNLVQHREGFALIDVNVDGTSRVHFQPPDMRTLQDARGRALQDVAVVLRGWADRLEAGIDAVLDELV